MWIERDSSTISWENMSRIALCLRCAKGETMEAGANEYDVSGRSSENEWQRSFFFDFGGYIRCPIRVFPVRRLTDSICRERSQDYCFPAKGTGSVCDMLQPVEFWACEMSPATPARWSRGWPARSSSLSHARLLTLSRPPSLFCYWSSCSLSRFVGRTRTGRSLIRMRGRNGS